MGSAQASRSDVLDAVDTERIEAAEPECSAPQTATSIERRSTGALAAELLRRWSDGSKSSNGSSTRQRPVLVAALAAVLGSGGGIGGSWLLGPGGLADDDALRDSVEANATAIAANAEAIREHGRQLAQLSADMKAAAADVDALGHEDRELEAMIADGLVAQASVLAKLAAKHDIDVDLRLPPLGRRRR